MSVKITVIMPVYNSEQYLRDAIESIITQSFKDFEFLIISEFGSNIESIKIIQSYNDTRIKLIWNEHKMGIAATLNRGINLARGEYLARMDADDISLPLRFEKQIEFMDMNVNVGICGTFGRLFGDENWDFKPSTSPAGVKMDLLFGCPLLHPSVMMRKSLLNKHSLRYDESLVGTEDYELWSRAAEYFSIANIEETLIYYRKHEDSATKRNDDFGKMIYKGIMRNQIIKLGVELNDAELEFHHKIFTIGSFELEKIILWLEKLYLANNHFLLYNPDFFFKKINSLLTFFIKNSILSLTEERDILRKDAEITKELHKKFATCKNNRFYQSLRADIKKFRTYSRSLRKTIKQVFLKRNQYFDVIFLIGCWEGESKRYRVYNIADGLKHMGYKIHIMPFDHIDEIAQCNMSVRTVVLFRAIFDNSGRVDRFFNYAKTNGIKTVFDIDDFVFDASIIDQIDGVKSLSPTEQKGYLDTMHGYRKLLLASDIVTVPVDYLRIKAEEITGRPSFVIPNSINNEQLIIASQLTPKEKNSEWIKIGYFSGSKTHQADFLECADALFNLMQSKPNTLLCIVGYLDLDGHWNELASRIERIDFQPYQKMLHILNDCDINIAPLQIASAFCHGKSELKFFEAALLAVPTIASATNPYSRIIVNGINGFIAKTNKDWQEAFDVLVNSPDLRKAIGIKAKETAINKYAIDHVASYAAQVYGLKKICSISSKVIFCLKKNKQLSSKSTAEHKHSLASEPAQPLEESKCFATPTSEQIKISWIIPPLIIGGGGHRNILRVAYFLSQLGHQISLYFINTDEHPQTIKQKIREHFYPLDCPVYLFKEKTYPTDVLFCTHWSTVSAALASSSVAKKIMYFVQDFEPLFVAMSSEYILAENTYRLGLYHITSGPWCESILRRDFNADADHFCFPLDRSVYYSRKRTKPNKNIIFFAKPELPRRCFELGVMALNEFHKLCPDVEIIMFGSKKTIEYSFEFPVTHRGILKGISDLADMYSNGDIGLVISTTNPSLVPYEMMACGLVVVDLARGNNEINYGGRTDITFLADSLPKKMAAQIANLINNKKELSLRRENGISFVGQFPSEYAVTKHIESLILSNLKKYQQT